MLGSAGKSTIVVNVPGTWPPRPVRGVLIAPARAATLEEIVYPHALGSFLRGIGYRLDVDTRSGQEGNKDDLLADLDLVLRKRFEAAFSLLHREPWDFFQLHISETDRINHFFWEDYERDTPGYGRAFLSFYRTLDALIGELLSIVPAGAEVIVLSGNGFRRLRREIYLNRALEERGWLEFERGEGRRLGMISRDARAYSLAPGRVFLHLKGREPKGGISGSEEYRGYPRRRRRRPAAPDRPGKRAAARLRGAQGRAGQPQPRRGRRFPCRSPAAAPPPATCSWCRPRGTRSRGTSTAKRSRGDPT